MSRRVSGAKRVAGETEAAQIKYITDDTLSLLPSVPALTHWGNRTLLQMFSEKMPQFNNVSKSRNTKTCQLT